MICIRKSMFETNSSSCNTFIYYRDDLSIPTKIYLGKASSDNYDILEDYYDYYGDDFIAWLQKIGVKEIYVKNELVTEIKEQTQPMRLMNEYCESHNDDIGDEEIVKYILFGKLVEEGHSRESAHKLCEKYRNNTQYVISDWFV